jgi:hypothetical protein
MMRASQRPPTPNYLGPFNKRRFVPVSCILQDG